MAEEKIKKTHFLGIIAGRVISWHTDKKMETYFKLQAGSVQKSHSNEFTNYLYRIALKLELTVITLSMKNTYFITDNVKSMNG